MLFPPSEAAGVVHRFSTAFQKNLQDFFLVVKILFNIVKGLYLLTHPYKSPAEHNASRAFSFSLKPFAGARFSVRCFL